MKISRRTYSLAIALCLCITLQAQMESHLTYRRYITQDGLPQIQAERLWQDSRGYIYIGTLSGFVRFDGQTFTPFLKGKRFNIVGFIEVWDNKPEVNSQPQQPGVVRALGFFRQWTVGFSNLEPLPLDPRGHWLLNNLNAGSLPNGYVLFEDSLEQNRLLCTMTTRGYQPLFTHSLLNEMTPDRKLFLDPQTGEVIVPLPKGVYKLSRDGKKATKLSDKGDVFTLLKTNSALLAFASDGIYTVGSNGLKRIKEADWKETSYGLTVRMLRSGSIVIADEHTVYLYEKGTIQTIASGINLIRDMLVDRWDRLWLATYQGVYCFFNRCFRNYQLTDANDIVRAVAVAKNGMLVMGTLNGKVMTNTPSGHCVVIDENPEQFYAASAVTIGEDVLMAGNGDIACITVQADETATFRWLQLPRDRYQFVGKAWGKLITGNRNSIFAYDLKTAALDTLTTEILHPWCAAEGADGLLWIGSSSGLFSINRQHKVTKAEYEQQKLIITAMEADQRGNVFFASADSLFVVQKQGKNILNLNTQMPQLSGHEIRSLHVSLRGYLVVAVVDGLFVCRISNDFKLSDIRFFNQQNGFTMTEPLKAMMTESSDGTVWLPGVEQMMSFRPADLLVNDEEETYIAPPLRWWQHWWVWLIGLVLLSLAIWAATYWYVKRRNQQRMIRLQSEKLQREKQIQAIRQKAVEANNELAKDIVRMTEKTYEQRLTLRTATGTLVVDVKDIAYFKGDGNYSHIVTFREEETVLTGLGALEKKLSPEVFVRADRSTLVNIHHIYSLQPKQRRCIFRSVDGQEVETTLLAPAFKRLQQFL